MSSSCLARKFLTRNAGCTIFVMNLLLDHFWISHCCCVQWMMEFCDMSGCRFTPKTLNSHTTYFTVAFTIVLVVVFFYMAGEFPRYERLIVSV